MNKATILHAFPSFEVGGSQIRFASIANRYPDRYRHLIVAMNGRSDCVDRLDPGVEFELLDIRIEKNRTLGNCRVLRRHLAALRPDVLVTYNWGAIEWALANILPFCRHIHVEDGFGPDEAEGRLSRRRGWFRRIVLSAGSRVVLPSETLYKIASQVWRLPRKRLAYIPNGIDCHRFAAAPDQELAAGLRRHPAELLVGTVATLRPEKNLFRLIEAFARVCDSGPPARLIIVGDGSERPGLERAAQERGLGEAVLFTGALREPERILGALDVFALSSDTEQMPYSILEAMAAGLPVASVDVGDVRRMLAPASRALVVSRSAEALATAISSLLGDAALRAELGRGNRDHVRLHYEQTRMFESYAALFDGEEFHSPA